MSDISYNINIDSMKREDINGLTNVVTELNCSMIAYDANGREAAYPFVVTVDEPNPDNFTDFNDLEEEQVIAWVQNYLDSKNMYEYEIKESLKAILGASSSSVPW
jgi:hypothetical protein